MALFLDRRSGLPVTSKLREVFPPAVAPSDCPVYILDESESDVASTVSDWSDLDDDVFHEALEDQMPPRPPLRLPVEVLDDILLKTQEDTEGDEATLRAASLVSKDWEASARRLLFAQCLPISSQGGVKRLRSVFDNHPELASAAKYVDLSNPGAAWQDGRVGEIFRRAAGLLRQTPNVSEISLLQTALNPKTRKKLFGALRALPIRSAHLYSSYSSFGRYGATRAASGNIPEMDELALLLCAWRELDSLTLSGYSSYPRLLSPSTAPVHAFPSYRLTNLTLISCDLTDLLWLVGKSGSSLKRLNIAATAGLSKEVLTHLFQLVGPTLEVLLLSLDIDDLHPSSSADPIDNAVVRPLQKLKVCNLSTDTAFSETILNELVVLPLIHTISLCFPAFTPSVVQSAVESVPVPSAASRKAGVKGNEAKPLMTRELTLDAWETSTTIDEAQRWSILQACEKRGIELSLNGFRREDIESDWYGEDVSGDWSILERAEQPRRGSRVRPIWR
ncbi:hypothetical protein JCM8097_004449 [Rhodosporidiobolus ruineniae]